MTRLPPSRFQPSRPNRKARRYSTTCTPGRNRPGTRASVTRPSFTVHPVALEVAVLERQDGGDARLDGRALVVGGDEDGDRRQRVALHEPLEVFVLRQSGLLPDLGDREHEQERIEGIQHQEEEQDGEVAPVNDGAHAAYSANACEERPRTSRAMSRLGWCAPTSTASRALRPDAPKRGRAAPARNRTHPSPSRSASRTS